MEAGFQRSVWINGAGDDWLKRNRDSLGGRDLTEGAISHLREPPQQVLEVGCSNGWRLKKLRAKYGCTVAGIDPSPLARQEAQTDGIDVYSGTAERLNAFSDNSFDMVIYGFCFCFISPEDWLAIVSESNRVLRDRGSIVIYDFVGTRFLKRRMMKIFNDSDLEEKPLYLYNFDWPQLWLSHPAYRTVVEVFDMNKAEVCTILQKGLHHLINDDIKTT